MTEITAHTTTVVTAGGFVLGWVFGLSASRGNFCTMGALSDIVNIGHWGRMRMWMLALAVALTGTATLHYAGLFDVSKAVAQRPVVPWLSLLAGGLLFGVGMTLAGGCANKNLLRLGAGSLRSLVVLVFMGLVAYMSLKGILGQWRANWFDPVAVRLNDYGWNDQALSTTLARAGGLNAKITLLATSVAFALILTFAALKDIKFRRNTKQITTALVLGALIPLGWYITGHLGYGENTETLEHVYVATNSRTIESISFVAPVAYGLELLMLWTDRSLALSFGTTTAIGAVAGAATYAVFTRTFRVEGFASLSDLKRHLAGAVLMGFGGVLALGCTVGQGMTGLSTLSIGSIIAMGGIIIGCVSTLKYMLWSAEREA